MSSSTLSLRAAIFINLNIILGTGIFINAALLAQHAGPWGPVTYLMVGTLLLPLIFALARLVIIHKGGSFYEYAAPAHPFIGFISQWSYFVGKMAASTLGIHIFASLMQSIFVPLQALPPLVFDSCLIVLFVAGNMLNLRINRSIQVLFFVLKMIPVLFIIITGIIWFSPEIIAHAPLDMSRILVTIPFALYAFTGFEATCSLIHTLENPVKDGPKAIIYSYGLGVAIAVLFQFFMYNLTGPSLSYATTFLDTFPLVFKSLFGTTAHIGLIVIHSAIACSALGAAYGVMFSNAWNLFTLAEKKLVWRASTITRLTKTGVPYICVLVEGFIALVYMLYTQAGQVALQQVNTLALTTTFTLSVVGLMMHYKIRKERIPLVGWGALASCLLLLGFLVKNFMHYRTWPTLPFIIFLCWGIVNFLANFKKHQGN